MNIFLSILLIITLLILLPIPLKITLSYNGKKALFRIYGKEININRKDKNKIKEASIKTTDKIEEDVIHEDLINPKNARKVIKLLRRNKFKLGLKVHIKIYYSLEDAAHVAILYGVLSSVLSYLNTVLSMFFNVKKYKFNIYPQYNNNYVNFQITSIVFINLAKIIYICVIIIYNLKFKDRKPFFKKAQYKEEMQNG